MLKETDLLNHIRQTTEMGQLGIDMVRNEVESQTLRDALEQQKTEYAAIFRSADTMLRERGEPPKELNPMAKLSSSISSSAKTMYNCSDSKIAEMVIQGNTKGVTKSLQCLNDYSGGENEVTKLAKKLLRTEEANIEQMKSFL